MKKIITQKELLEQGFEQFKYAGEYLFVGNAVIYIDKGDDDIIKFHDGKKYIRFIMSQRDIIVFFKGDLDMIRISGKTEFDMKIVSERVTFEGDFIADILQEMSQSLKNVSQNTLNIDTKLGELGNSLIAFRNESKLCCQTTNENLVKIQEEISKIEIPVPEEPIPVPAVNPVIEWFGTSDSEFVWQDGMSDILKILLKNGLNINKRYGTIWNVHYEISCDFEYDFSSNIDKDGDYTFNTDEFQFQELSDKRFSFKAILSVVDDYGQNIELRSNALTLYKPKNETVESKPYVYMTELEKDDLFTKFRISCSLQTFPDIYMPISIPNIGYALSFRLNGQTFATPNSKYQPFDDTVNFSSSILSGLARFDEELQEYFVDVWFLPMKYKNGILDDIGTDAHYTVNVKIGIPEDSSFEIKEKSELIYRNYSGGSY